MSTKGNSVLVVAIVCLLFVLIAKIFLEIAASAAESQKAIVSIDRAGNVYLLAKKMDLSDLSPELKAFPDITATTPIYLRADKDVSSGRTIEVIDTIKTAGFTNIALVANFQKRNPITLAEIDALKNQIANCWIAPVDAETVTLDLKMNSDHSIHHMQATDQSRYIHDPPYKLSADAAMTALQKPACQKLTLPNDMYEEWKDLVLTFDPRDAPPPQASEKDLIKQQLSVCWNVPIGATQQNSLAVEVVMDIAKDGTVQKAKIVDSERMKADPYFQTVAKSALLAIHNPKCSPLELPADKYDEWKHIILTFNPKDVM